MKFRKNFLFALALFFSFFTFFYMGKSAGLKSSINSLSHPQLNFSSKNSNSHGPGDNPKLAPTISLKNALAANRATLLSYLFSEAFQADLAQNETFSQLTHKFEQPYPKEEAHHSFAFQSELASRITILKAMQRTDSIPEVSEKKFLVSVLKNKKENWLVKRQALQNLRDSMRDFSESERAALIGSVDLRSRALAAKTEEEILSASVERKHE